jgi:hypothetical protein
MANIFNIDNNIEDFSEKLDIDELYERKRVIDIQKLELFNKILNRIHLRIKLTSKKTNDNYCWFVIPEIILGVSYFDQAGCISYVLDKLKSNGFHVFYYHPNTIHISWKHWIPKYVRDEIKKKTGLIVDEHGKYSEPVLKIEQNPIEKPKKSFTPINSYKPKGFDLFDK